MGCSLSLLISIILPSWNLCLHLYQVGRNLLPPENNDLWFLSLLYWAKGGFGLLPWWKKSCIISLLPQHRCRCEATVQSDKFELKNVPKKPHWAIWSNCAHGLWQGTLECNGSDISVLWATVTPPFSFLFQTIPAPKETFCAGFGKSLLSQRLSCAGAPALPAQRTQGWQCRVFAAWFTEMHLTCDSFPNL